MAAALKKRLGELLIQNKLLKKEKLEEALQVQKQTKEKIGSILVRLGHITEDTLLEVLSSELKIPFLHLSRFKVHPDITSLVPRKIAELYCLMPLSRMGDALTIAMADPMNVHALDDLGRMTNLDLRPFLAGQKDIHEAIEQFYSENVSQAIQTVIEDMASGDALELDEASSVLSRWQRQGSRSSC